MTDAVLDRGPVSLLRKAVQSAQHELLAGPCDLPSVDVVLATLFTDLTPVYRQLEAMATAQPGGPVAAVLAHLRVGFTHAAAGRPAPAVSSVVTAAATTFRLADEDALDTDADLGRWR
jgi:hypothetical protein